MSGKGIWVWTVIFVLTSGGIFAQPENEDVLSDFPQLQSREGWRPLWNGEDWDGLQIYLKDKGMEDDMDGQVKFVMEDSIIHAPDIEKGNAHLFTTEEYSWYHVRIDYRFMEDGNAGLIVMADLDQLFDPGFSYGNNRPRSIEVNMKRSNEDPWTLWSASGLGPYITTTVEEGTNIFRHKSEGGVEWTNDPWGQRVVESDYPNPENPIGEWNHGEAIMMGDSLGIFILNGQVRTMGWDFRLRGPDGSSDPEDRVPIATGGIGLQYEGAEIMYKNWEIRELIGCTDEDAVNYGSWYVKDSTPSTCVYAGCKDDNYEEYDESADISDSTMCRTLSVDGGIFRVKPGMVDYNSADRTLHVGSAGPHSFAISDGAGRKVYERTSTGPGVYDLSGIGKQGVYIFRMNLEGKTYLFRRILNF